MCIKNERENKKGVLCYFLCVRVGFRWRPALAALHLCLESNRRIMSGRPFAGGMLIGVILGSTGWWQYSGQDSPQQVRVASERNRPLALGLTVPPPATEQIQATVDDAPPTPTVAAAGSGGI